MGRSDRPRRATTFRTSAASPEIVEREDGWALLDDQGATLLSLGRKANGASLFDRRMIFR